MARVAGADVTVQESLLDPLTLRVTMGRIHPIDTPTGANEMTTAQRIIASNSTAQAIEAEARDLATKTTAANCFDRTWTFCDGSSITKTRDGYTTEAK